MKKKVFVLQGEHPGTYQNMFKDWGYEIVYSPEEADLLVFTGGADVNPELYDHVRHPTTRFSNLRDDIDVSVYNKYHYKPCVGVCRGGQLLNVMNGGTLFQDVSGHACYSGHLAKGVGIDELMVSSTHHQMMIPTKKGHILLWGSDDSPRRETWSEESHTFMDGHRDMKDVECVHYPNTNDLCFQPHPEYFEEDHPCQILFFTLLDEYLFQGE